MQQGSSTKFGQMETTDGKQLLLCAEITRYPTTQAFAAIPEGTIIEPVLEVHIVKILDGYGIEVAISSVANPMDTSYVAKSRETEPFSGPVTNCSQTLKDQEEVHCMKKRNLKHQGNLCAWEHQGNFCEPSQHSAYKSIPKTQRTIPTNDRKWKVMHAHSSDGRYLAVGYKSAASLWPRWKTNGWFKTLGHTQGQYCWERSHKKAHEISMKDFGHTWFMEAAIRKRLEYWKDNNGSPCYFERIKIGSNKTGIREDLANENILFSKKSSRAIFEMGNVSSLSWRNHRFNAHHACTTFLKEYCCANAVG